jgi:DNA mismatch repair protein MutS
MALTQMMKQYLAIKEEHKDCIVFYRLGDFYEMFFDDAEVVHRELGLTLTGRDCGLEKRAPMCGVPAHSYLGYVKKLVDKGFKVAICEQLTAPQKGQMVERGVVKIITAGTVTDENCLDSGQNNYVAAVFEGGSVAWCDITTGEFYAVETKNSEDVLGMINPAEVIKSDGHFAYAFSQKTALGAITKYFGIIDTKVFDFCKDSAIARSSGALLEYLMLTQKQALANISKIQVLRTPEFMILDKTARENLELTHQFREPSKKHGSLLWVLDDTKTAMGARMLARWVGQPLQDIKAINARLDAVEEFSKGRNASVERILAKIFDIHRLVGKVASGDIMPRDCLALGRSLGQVSELKQAMGEFESAMLQDETEKMNELSEVVELIARAIDENCPAVMVDGGFIRPEYDEKLEELRNSGAMGREWISKLEAKERLECQIKELKIGYNRIAGYYFEVPIRKSAEVPYRFTRRATTASTERFITQELKEIEEKILGADVKAVELERRLFAEVVEFIKQHLNEILQTAEAVATIDVLRSLASVAVANRWVKPTLSKKCETHLKDARHPVVEKLIGANKFIANDCDFDATTSTKIITGPNMAGKSTYMRTVALNVLLAHIGSFVACKAATVGLVDRIFTRIGASDSMITGQSTFMVEMNEVSNIIHNATERSLLLLDEIGRGTGTNDGLALATAIISYITDKIKCRTMFATHFHQLTKLADTESRISNYKVMVSTIDGEIIFLHKVAAGAEQNSFGIDVARLSGLPQEIIQKAKELMKK